MQDYVFAIIGMVVGSALLAFCSERLIAGFEDRRISILKRALVHIREGRPDEGGTMVLWVGRHSSLDSYRNGAMIVFSLCLMLIVLEFNLAGGLGQIGLAAFVLTAFLFSGVVDIIANRPGRKQGLRVVLVQNDGIQFASVDEFSNLLIGPRLLWKEISGLSTNYVESGPVGLEIKGPGIVERTDSDMVNHGLFCRLLADELLALGKPQEDWVVKGNLPMGPWTTPVRILKDEVTS